MRVAYKMRAAAATRPLSIPNDPLRQLPDVNPIRADHKVLIIASDPLLGALVGSLVEATRLHATFPRENERPEDALARVRPLAAILVDAITSESESDLFLARDRRRQSLVLMFG